MAEVDVRGGVFAAMLEQIQWFEVPLSMPRCG
jgi:hypothetical protein